MACLDTNFLSAMIKKDANAKQKLQSLRKRRLSVSTTIINIAELYYGAYNSQRKSQNLADLQMIINTLNILELDNVSAERYGILAADPSIKASPVGAFDLLIASIAIVNNEPVVTQDGDFNNIPNLNVESW